METGIVGLELLFIGKSETPVYTGAVCAFEWTLADTRRSLRRFFLHCPCSLMNLRGASCMWSCRVSGIQPRGNRSMRYSFNRWCRVGTVVLCPRQPSRMRHGGGVFIHRRRGNGDTRRSCGELGRVGIIDVHLGRVQGKVTILVMYRKKSPALQSGPKFGRWQPLQSMPSE